jgi:hypothetical protein
MQQNVNIINFYIILYTNEYRGSARICVIVIHFYIGIFKNE